MDGQIAVLPSPSLVAAALVAGGAALDDAK
jgi:hypothetical protein